MTFQIAHARRPLARRNTHAGLAALGPDQFEGYASLFGVADGAGDSVAPGAFAASLRRRGPGQVRLLYQHFSHAPIGVWEEIAEDARGLYVRGRLVPEVEQARDVRALLAEGALNGLSIGFRLAGVFRSTFLMRCLVGEVQQAALPQFMTSIGASLGQGGAFDYQRSGNHLIGFLQLPQFRDLSNFNIGLYMQRTGQFSEKDMFSLVGQFASHFSSNYMPDQPYGLDPRNVYFIRMGYRAAANGVFGKP